MSERVAAVVLNWNCAPETIRCVRSLAAGTIVPDITIVDNGSVDDSLANLSALDIPVTLVPLTRNLGYAGGMNAGIRVAGERGASHVWLLNADAVPSSTALSALLAHAGTYAIAASLEVSSSRPWSGDETAHTTAAMLPGGHVRAVDCGGCGAGHHRVDVVTGASLFAGTKVLADAGLMDETFFHYKEEFDLAYRIGLAGGAVGFVCASRVWHQRGASLDHASPRARYYYARNEILFIRKHYRRPLWRMFAREPIHYRNLLAAVAGTLGRRPGRASARAVLAGYVDGVRGVTGPTERF